MAGKRVKDDRFKKFGTVSFTSITKVNDFVNFLKEGKIAGTQCNICNKKFFPPKADCSHCLSSNIKWFYINGLGNLISYSTLRFAPKGFETDLPYTIALLDFGEYKAFGRIDNSIELSDIVIEMPMKISVKYLENEQISYVFQKK